MNPEIKRLLMLSSIPNFKLSAKEEAKLEAWKASQRPITITPTKKMRSKATRKPRKPSKKEKVVDISSADKTTKIKNVITPEELTLNDNAES